MRNNSLTEPWERIEAVMKYFRLNKNSFSEEIGMSSNMTIGRILNEKRRPTSSTLAKIVSRFPQIDYDWLLTGQGSMIRDVNFSGTQNVVASTSIGNKGIQNNISLSGSEKIIGSDGSVSIEPVRPQAKYEDAAEIRIEVERLRRECAEWKGKYETIKELYQDLLSIVKK